MFMLKFPAATSSPSLLASAVPSPPSPPRRACSPTRSPSSASSLLQEQKQRDQRRRASPLSIPRARTASLLSLSPQRTALPSSSAAVSPSLSTTHKKQKAKLTVFLGDQTADESGDMMLSSDGYNSTSASSSRQSMKMIEEDEQASESSSSSSSHNVSVCVRMRPSKKTSNEEVWALDGDKNRIVPSEHHPAISKRQNGISSPSKKASVGLTFAPNGTFAESTDDAYDFRFDTLVLPTMNIDEMYRSNISPIVDAVVGGYNGTVFAYGQTGSGKTHTMSGSSTEKGVIPRAVEEIFDEVSRESSRREFLLRVSYLEIYNETLKDLLAPYPTSFSSTDLSARPASPIKGGSSHVAGVGTDLRIVEAGGRIQIQGLREEIVTSAGEVLNLIEWGQQRRHQAATDWNERSSRSHCVFILTVESRDQSEDRQSDDDVRFSQLNLIDLAGSERAATEKERRKEGAFINRSLLTLGTVIAKLSEQCQTGNDDGHIPYRDSKLTRLLQTSLGGNARVAVVCTISPDKDHAIETLSTLRFGHRCKSIITKAKKGTVVNDKALIARYKKELERLRSQLEQGPSSVLSNVDGNSIRELQSQKEEAEKDVQSMSEKREELKKQVEHLTRLILTGKSVVEETQSIEMDTEKSVGTPRPRKLMRMSDMGTSSPSKRIKLLPETHRMPLTPLRDGQEDFFMTPTSITKSSSLESEVASLKKTLALTAAGRQASEDARIQEMQAWKSRVMELEAAYTEQEEELDEAEAAYKKLQSERDALKSRVEEEMEANRLLQLVATSRSDDDNGLKQLKEMLEDSQREAADAKTALQMEMERQQRIKQAQSDQMMLLKQQLTALQSSLDEERCKSEHIRALQQEVHLLGSTEYPNAANAEVYKLRKQLNEALQAKEQAQNELRDVYSERGQEDAERDFADLIKNTSGEEDITTAKMRRKDAKIHDSYKELEEAKKQIQDEKQGDLKSPVKIAGTASVAIQTTSAHQDRPPAQRAGSLEDGEAISYHYEIERLNAVIASQGDVMRDLNASVDAWKGRLRLQHDIITRLVESTGGSIPIPEDLHSPSLASSQLKRASSSISSANSTHYSAHTSNKAASATGLGLGSISPTKGVGWLATMPGVKPDPIATSNLLSSPGNRNTRRKTIEHEIQELKGSPRVKSTTDRLLTSKASTASLRTLPSTPGSPAKLRQSRDYYI